MVTSARPVVWGVVGLLAAAFSAGCFRNPLQAFDLNTPPAMLVPTSLAGVNDQRGRFREVYCALRLDHGAALPEDRPCEQALVRLGDEPRPTGRPVAFGPRQRPIRIAVVPGLFGECIIDTVSPFSDALSHLETHGYRTGVIRVSGMSSCANNARQIRDSIRSMTLAPGERLVLVGHSKGAVDILESLVTHPEIVPHVAAVVSVAGAIAGSPLADGLRDMYGSLLRALDVKRCDPGDSRGLESLGRSTRLAFLAHASLPASVRYYSVVGIVPGEEVSPLLSQSYRRLSEIDPRNDGQIIFSDAVIPRGALLGFARADHFAIAMPFSRTARALAATLITQNAFPREVLLEAIVRTVEEQLE